MKDKKKIILIRLYMVYFATLLFAFVIIGRIIYLQFVIGAELRTYSEQRNYSWNEIDARRGTIYSADGVILCQAIPFYDVFMDPLAQGLPKQVLLDNINALGDSLQKHFGLNKNQFVKTIRGIREGSLPANMHYPVVKNITWQQNEKIKTFPIFNRGRNRGGFINYEIFKTYYPHGSLARRTIGEHDAEREIFYGLNSRYNDELSGTPGQYYAQRIKGVQGYPMHSGSTKIIEPKEGYNIVSTINFLIQDITDYELRKKLIAHEAKSGCAIIMEVETGHIKAIANLRNLGNGNFTEDNNYAVSHLADPGSTMKLAALMVAFEDGHIKIDDTVNCRNGHIRLYKKDYNDERIGGHGRISVKDIFKESSNVGMVTLIEKYYNYAGNKPLREKEVQRRVFTDGLYRLGLNQRVNTEIENEPHPQIKKENFSDISLLQMAIGYEMLMTPLQILTFYNAVANNGKMVKPMFVKEIREGTRTIKKIKPTVLQERIAKPETIAFAKEIMEAVVKEGTGRSIRNTRNYAIAGKTGTAKINHPKYGFNHNDFYNSYFAGYFPADEPKYSAIVVINKPNKEKGGIFGGLLAAPVVKEVADVIYAMELGIKQEEDVEATPHNSFPVKNGYQKDLEVIFNTFNKHFVSQNPNTEWVYSDNKNRIIELKTKEIEEGRTPNVAGMSLRDALALLENIGFKVVFEGIGVVKKQSVKAGEEFNKGQIIKLTLSLS